MVQETVRQPERATKDRRLVQELQDLVSEGGQMPLYRRIPKRGFKNRNRLEIVAINISALEKFDNGADVTVDTLIESGIVKNPKDGVKILGNGELTKKLNVKANAFSASAKEKIEALGGTCEVI